MQVANGSATPLLHLLSLVLLGAMLLLLSRFLWQEVSTVLTGYSRREEGDDVGQG